MNVSRGRPACPQMTEKRLARFHVIYGPGNTIRSVAVERMSEAPQNLPADRSQPAM